MFDDALIECIADHGLVAINELFDNPRHPTRAASLIAQRMLVAGNDITCQQTAGYILEVMIEKGHLPLDDPSVQKLMEFVAPDRLTGNLEPRHRYALKALLRHPELSTDWLLRFYRWAEEHRRPEDILAHILTHPNTPPEVWRGVLMGTTPVSATLVAVCSRTERIRRDPVVRDLLIAKIREFRPPYWLPLFVTDADPKDCAPLFREVAERDVKEAAKLLVEHGHRIAPFLEVQDLEPLLRSSDYAARIAAMGCLGQVGRENVGQKRVPAKRT